MKFFKWILLLASIAGAACIDGKWDVDYTWIKDCTGPYDGLYNSATPAASYSGSTTIMAGGTPHTLSWKLHYFRGNLTGSLSGAALPMVVALHPWSDGTPIASLLNIESDIMQYEGSWEDVIFLSFALENGNDLNTWWDGSLVAGVPTTWVMSGITSVVRSRLADATTLLTSGGAVGIGTKTIDTNRVYLVGTSMGGAGAYHNGIRHPDLYAAIHANAGFADYNGGPCGTEAFCTSFTNDFIGTGSSLNMIGLDGASYGARNYSDMSWFIRTHKGASWTAANGGRRYEPPYINITHGNADASVDISSVLRLKGVLDSGHYGYSFNRHTGGHSGQNFLQLHWLLGFRKNQSYLAFTNNSTDLTNPASQEFYNDLTLIKWLHTSIIDVDTMYSVQIVGTGTVDITPRRLQAFHISPSHTYRYWKNSVGSGATVNSTSDSVLTLPGVTLSGTTTLVIKDNGGSVPTPPDTTTPPPPPTPVVQVYGPTPTTLLPTGSTISVSTVAGLVSAVASATKGQTILMADTTYNLTAVLPLHFHTDSVMLYGASRNPDKVILTGAGFGTSNTNEEIIKISATGIRLAYFTLRDGRANGLKLQAGGSNNLLVHNVYFVDICERSFKAPDQAVSYGGEFRFCLFEQVTPITGAIPNLNDNGDYIGGMDMMKLDGWNIHDNYFRNIRGQHGGGRGAIFMWNYCKRMRIERNVFQGCDRSISLGNPSSPLVGADSSIIRNNFIVAGSGISIEVNQSKDNHFAKNTVLASPSYYRALQFLSDSVPTAPNYFDSNRIVGRTLVVSGPGPNMGVNLVVTDSLVTGAVPVDSATTTIINTGGGPVRRYRPFL